MVQVEHTLGGHLIILAYNRLGTRFDPTDTDKVALSHKFCDDLGVARLTHVLAPRARGFHTLCQEVSYAAALPVPGQPFQDENNLIVGRSNYGHSQVIK